MKLITFTHKNKTRVGAVVDNQVVDSTGSEAIPNDMLAFLQAGNSALQAMQQLINSSTTRLDLATVKLEAPINNPQKFLGIGLNYADHISETQLEKPEYPLFFNKQVNCITAHNSPIYLPHTSDKVDYEGELAFIIGKRCRNVPIERAHEVIAGFSIVNDVSVRDWQMRSPTWTLGKSFDTHGPIGPWIVTTDEITDPHHLQLTTWVDGEQRQSANTQQMIFNCYEMIVYLSSTMTLEAGDIISTGTPSGVGVKMKPRGYLKAGQVVKIEIENIGVLSNPVIDEPEARILI